MKRVLLIEDDEEWVEDVVCALKGKEVEIVWNGSLQLAQASIANELHDYDAIGMDACVESIEPDTLGLTTEIRNHHFKGPVVACSAEPRYSQMLMDAGATHTSKKGCELAKCLLEVLFAT